MPKIHQDSGVVQIVNNAASSNPFPSSEQSEDLEGPRDIRVPGTSKAL